jgi:hypothetical protein
MANYYCSPTGNDTTGDGSAGNPFKTINKAMTASIAGDEIRCEKTTVTNVAGANCTWTKGASAVLTSASLVGSIAVGDLISRPTGGGNGNTERCYYVESITATTITIMGKYWGVTGTDTDSIHKRTPTTGFSAASGVAMATMSVNVKVSGGWNLGTETRDGETWASHAGANTLTTNTSFNFTSDGEIEYFNITNGYTGFTITGNFTATISNCSTERINRNGVLASSPNCILNNICLGSNTNTAQAPLVATVSSAHAWSDVKAVGVNSTNAFTHTGNGIVLKNCIALGCNNGLVNATNCGIEDSYAEGCTNGINMANNSYVKNCTSIRNTSGIGKISNLYSCRYDNCLFQENTTAYDTSRHIGHIFDSCTFINNGTDASFDVYTAQIYFNNCTHTTPTSWAYDATLGMGTVVIKGCTIDAPSIAKAIRIVSGIQYTVPQFILMGFFGLPDGAYYANGSILKDASTLSPLGNYTLRFVYNSVVSLSKADYIAGVMAVNSSVAQNVSYQLRANGVWTGTLIPMLKLNGKVIKTGTAITSISNGSWDSKSISVTPVEVTEDGELTLEFNINSNTVAINVGDITVT